MKREEFIDEWNKVYIIVLQKLKLAKRREDKEEETWYAFVKKELLAMRESLESTSYEPSFVEEAKRRLEEKIGLEKELLDLAKDYEELE